MKKTLYLLVLISGMAYGQKSAGTSQNGVLLKAPAENEVAIYKLDVLLNDTVVVDESANLNHGMARNGPFITEGRIGNALGFDGVDDYVRFFPSTSFDIGGSEVTVSLWTKLAFLPADLPFSYGPLFDSESDQYVLYEDKGNNQLRFKVATSDGAARPAIEAADLVVDQWIQVVGVYDGTEARVYLNGEKKGMLPITGTVNTGQAATLGLSGTSYFKGSIDQVEIYNVAFTDEEVMARYVSTSISRPALSAFSLYPNPNNGKFTLDQKSLSFQNAGIEILNAQGKLVYKGNLTKSNKQFVQLPSAKKGIYFVKIYTQSGTHTQPMIVD